MEQIEEQGATVWVISPDTEERLGALWESEGLSFPSLRDPEGEVIRKYGIFNESQPPLPHPATIVIDREGVVQWLEIDVDYRVRPATATVVEALGELDSASEDSEEAGE